MPGDLFEDRRDQIGREGRLDQERNRRVDQKVQAIEQAADLGDQSEEFVTRPRIDRLVLAQLKRCLEGQQLVIAIIDSGLSQCHVLRLDAFESRQYGVLEKNQVCVQNLSNACRRA